MQCILPGGYVDESGVVHRAAELQPLSGREEEVLSGEGHVPSARAVTEVLHRCVNRIGDIQPITEATARRLLVADRLYLLLKLRELTFGDRVQATIKCPWPDCGERVDIDFSTRDIPVKESQDKGPSHAMSLSPEASLIDERGEAHAEVMFRLPCGADQEILAPLVAVDEARALTILFERCIQRIGGFEKPGEALIARLSPQARMEIERGMAAAAPEIEAIMAAACPECRREFTMPFDLQEFFFGEFRISRERLYREIHYLAYHYHWSEQDIMAMSRQKRRKYIEILSDEIERLNRTAV